MKNHLFRTLNVRVSEKKVSVFFTRNGLTTEHQGSEHLANRSIDSIEIAFCDDHVFVNNFEISLLIGILSPILISDNNIR